MKKILLVFTFLFLLIEQIPIFQQYMGNEIEAAMREQCAAVEIKEIGTVSSVEEFSQAVEAYAEENHTFIMSVSYPYQAETDFVIELFCAGDTVPNFLASRGITADKMNQLRQNGAVLSSKNKDFVAFSTARDYRISSVSGMQDKNLAREYQVYPASAAAGFQKYLDGEFGVAFYASGERIVSQETDVNQLAITAILMLAFLVFWAFWIASEYQLNAVKRLSGYSDAQCAVHLFEKLLAVVVAAFAANLICGFLFCGFYNRWSSYFNLLPDILKGLAPILGLLLLLAAVFLVFFYNGDVRYALKGKKPFRLLGICAAVLKGIVIVFLCSSFLSIQTSISQTREIQKQESYFAQIPNNRFVQIRLSSGSSEHLSKYEKKCRDFFTATEGVLINDKHIQDARNMPSSPAYDNTVYINADYLRLNPIYDTDGRRIAIDDNSLAANETIVLVPQSYQSQEQQIYDMFLSWYQFARYVTAGPKQSDTEDRSVQLKLQFVRDDQIYFAYNTDPGEIPYNEIRDPFAVIVTRQNMDPSAYEFHITNGEYFLADTPQQTPDELRAIAKDCGLEEELVNLPTLYSAVDVMIQEYHVKLWQSVTIFALSLFIVTLICLYLVRNYMEQKRKLIFVRKMLGYRFISGYGRFLLVSLLSESLLFLVLRSVFRMGWILWTPICVGFLLFDLLLMLAGAFLYQEALTKNALKGDGI